MPESFGARLRLRREEQGMALSAIAEDIKIKMSLLEAVERDDVSHWPSGIYRRAFIRAYAQAIGLDPDVVVREFLEIHPDPDQSFATASAEMAAMEKARTSAGPPTRLRSLVDTAIGSFSRLGRGPATNDAMAQRPVVQSPVVQSPVLQNPAAESPVVRDVLIQNPLDSYEPIDAPNVVAPEAPAAPVTPAEYAAVERTNEAVGESTPLTVPVPPADADGTSPVDVDFLAVAHVCTGFGRVRNADDLQPLLQEAARILDATGLIVWLWDDATAELRPALVYGYSEKVLAQLPTVGRDADNATAAAFRSARLCATSGALVMPMVESEGCAGVLALELQDGREQSALVQAASMIFAAALTQLVGASRPADAPPHTETLDEPVGKATRPLRVRR